MDECECENSNYTLIYEEDDLEWNAKEEETENEVCSSVHYRKTKMWQALDTYYCTPQTPHCTDVV